MYIATVTNQNQITIPAKVRQEQHIKPGDQVVFAPKKSGAFSFTRMYEPQDTFGILKSADKGQKYNPHAVWTSRYEG